MVGPGEVDDSLQEETAEECAKFGKVKKCLIFEVPGKKVPDDQAVRIFVQFAQKEAAQLGMSSPLLFFLSFFLIIFSLSLSLFFSSICYSYPSPEWAVFCQEDG